MSQREVGQIAGSEGKHEWIGTQEEMLDALLNVPVPLSPMVSIPSAQVEHATDSTEIARSVVMRSSSTT